MLKYLALGLRDPFLGCSPVVALTGGPYERSRGRNYYQEIEDFPLFKPVTRFSGQVFDATRLPDMLAHAFSSATSGKPGPAHLELAGHAGDVLEDQELDAHIPSGEPFSVPRVRSRPTDESAAEAAALLREAKRPVIVAGGGVRVSGAGHELLTLAERLQIPVATSLNAKEIVPGDHPLCVGVPGLYGRASANQVLLEADLVFFVVSQTGSQLTLTWQVPAVDTRVVQLDIAPEELGRHYPNTVAMLGDAQVGLQCVLEAVGDADVAQRADWVARAQELGARWREQVAPLLESDQVPIRPERLSAELTRHLPDDALLVADTGHAGMWTGGWVDLNQSGQGFIRAAGSLGWGLPAALGAQLAQPERPVVLFTGDGGLWYHLSELETAARWNIPAVIVANNNRSLNQEINIFTPAYGGTLHGRHSELWHFDDISLAGVAQSMGVTGITVTKANQFGLAMEQAVSAGGPVLIDVRTDIEALAPKGTTEPAAV